MHQLINQIATVLHLDANPPATYQNELDLVTTFPPVARVFPQAYAPTVQQAVVDQLAELRSEGVHEILNRQISTDAEIRALSDYNQQWWQRVVSVLEANFSKAEQLNFTMLGTIPNVIFPHTFDDDHAKIYASSPCAKGDCSTS